MLAVITDRHLQTCQQGEVVHYVAQVVSVSDYYPFGMVMKERSYQAASYAFGFNGMLKDDEVKGNGNSLDFGARIYDSRLGRWLSADPKFKKYAYYSPYLGLNNSPVFIIDANGEDGIPNHIKRAYNYAQQNNGTLSITSKGEVFVSTSKVSNTINKGETAKAHIVQAKGFKRDIRDKFFDLWNGADDFVEKNKGNNEFRFGVVVESRNGEVFENPDASKLKFDGSYFTIDRDLFEGLMEMSGTDRKRYFDENKELARQNNELTVKRNVKNPESESLKGKINEEGIKGGNPDYKSDSITWWEATEFKHEPGKEPEVISERQVRSPSFDNTQKRVIQERRK